MVYGLISIIKRGIIMTEFINIKLKINEIIDKNKQKYFKSKTIADIEEFGDPQKEEKMMGRTLISSVIGTFFLILISLITLNSLSFSVGKLLLVFTILFPISLSLYLHFVNELGDFFLHKSMKKKINNIENGTLSKDKITEELFENLFWSSKIDKETETTLKIILPYNLYLMLYSQRPSGLCYWDVSKFLENIQKYEKETKDIEDKRISIVMDVIKTSDIKITF